MFYGCAESQGKKGGHTGKLERVERKEKIPNSMWLNKEGLINHPNKHRWTDSERCLVCIPLVVNCNGAQYACR